VGLRCCVVSVFVGFLLVVLQVHCGCFLPCLCYPISCIYKRGTLATKGVSLGHQGFEMWMTACVGLVWTKKFGH